MKTNSQDVPLNVTSIEGEIGRRRRESVESRYICRTVSLRTYSHKYSILARMLVPGERGALRVLIVADETPGAELGRGRAPKATFEALRIATKEDLVEKRILEVG